MEAGFVTLIALASLVIGIAVGMLITKLMKKQEGTQGVIYAYYREQGNNPSLLLEYSVPIDDITSRKRVTFDVNVIQ